MTLDQASPQEHVRVLSLSHTGAMRRRLQELGLVPGTVVKCVGKSPGGDPLAYLIRGAVIAIRAGDASKIEVAREGWSWD